MIAMLEVALVATFQPCWTFKVVEEAHFLGVSSVAERGVDDGA